ncbi:MAG: HAMP domain-containing protein [Firmicutes bacterium]|nr:HAMP domain-containing protein [Bacillota bacterium]
MRAINLRSRSLLLDISIISIFAVLLGLGLSSLFFNYSINREFDIYVSRIEAVIDHRIASSITEIVESAGGFDPASEELDHLAMVMDVSLTVESPRGMVLYASRDRQEHMSNMKDAREYEMYHSPVAAGASRLSLDLTSGPADVKITHYKQEGIWTSEDLWFKGRIMVSILFGGVVSLLILLPVLHLLSRRISKPLVALTEATVNVSRGKSDEAVEVTAYNEIQTLANAFNEMLSRLKTVEGLRKKLISDVAHELRTPLGNLRSFIEAMEDGVLDNDTENLGKARAEADRLISLVKELQELTVAEAKALTIKKERSNLTDILDHVSAIMNPLFEEKGILFKSELPAFEIMADIDVQAVYRVVHNILYNAYHYTGPEGTVTISAVVERGAALISIVDTGVGIPESDLPYIFERFYRVDPSRSRQTGGTGLGLTIAKELIEAHGGGITAASEYGKGTSFFIRLPIAAGSFGSGTGFAID